MKTTYPGSKNRRQRWLSPERVHQKFDELRALLRGVGPAPVAVQAEFVFARERIVRRRR